MRSLAPLEKINKMNGREKIKDKSKEFLVIRQTEHLFSCSCTLAY